MTEKINELEKLANAKSAPPKTEEGIAYHRGLSTNLDVRNLDSELSILEGEEITHDAIEALIHQSRKSNRYKTVVAKWRKSLLADRNILLIPRIGVGYLVANAGERLGRAQSLHKQGVKRIFSSAAGTKPKYCYGRKARSCHSLGCTARFEARHGMARPGEARRGKAGRGSRRGRAGQGTARPGQARHGAARQGVARRGSRQGTAWRGAARLGIKVRVGIRPNAKNKRSKEQKKGKWK